jgi:anti-sigma regulatory factor (Ser/Thr protein kinase)
MTSPQRAHIELEFSPSVELVSIVRRFVSDVYGRLLGDPEATSRIALATHELLENAVKYSLDGTMTVRIAVEPADGGCRLCIRMINRAAPAQIASVRTIIDGMASSPDPIAYYQRLMREAAQRTHGSGLGLARIAAEGEMTMEYSLSGDELTLIATAPLRCEAGP